MGLSRLVPLVVVSRLTAVLMPETSLVKSTVFLSLRLEMSVRAARLVAAVSLVAAAPLKDHSTSAEVSEPSLTVAGTFQRTGFQFDFVVGGYCLAEFKSGGVLGGATSLRDLHLIG